MTFLKTMIGSTTLLALAACSGPAPSVPFSEGQNVASARNAINSCHGSVSDSGRKRLKTMYVVNTVLWGIPGIVGTAAYSQEIEQNGEADAADRCMEDLGFSRRELTDAEVRALNNADPTTRSALLNHFVAGGQLETFSST
ncbi:MAG: hypothetical protein ABJ327_01605 [Litoreibacter sp.]